MLHGPVQIISSNIKVHLTLQEMIKLPYPETSVSQCELPWDFAQTGVHHVSGQTLPAPSE